jgi:HSP20 family molecular chaperone IbpA
MTNVFRQTGFDVDAADLFWKDLFQPTLTWESAVHKINYPVDVYQEENGNLVIDIAVTGLDKKDISIKIEDGNILTIASNTQINSNNKTYIQHNITKKAFKFSWKVNAKFDIDKLTASMDKGLLNINIPLAPEKTKTIEIQ